MAEFPGRLLLSGYRLLWLAFLPVLRAAAWAGKPWWPGRWELPGRFVTSDEPAARIGESEAAQGNASVTLWMHCASLGEAKGLWGLAHTLSADVRLVLTANTAEGLAFLRDRGRTAAFATIAVAPFDHPGLVARFLARYRVTALCLYEVELWPHFIRACADRGFPVYLASARITPAAMRRRLIFPGFWKTLLDQATWIQAQSPEDCRRFRRLTRTPVEAGCDYKVLHFLAEARDPAGPGVTLTRPPVSRDRFAFISLHFEELEILLPGLQALLRNFPVTLFPRRLGEIPLFRASLEPLGFALDSRAPESRHVLVDSFGRVGATLSRCHSAWVGGGHSAAGCHNLWEPLAAGLRIYFGPNFQNQEPLAGDLLRSGLARMAATPDELEDLGKPEAGQAEACALFAKERRMQARTASERFRARMEATDLSIFSTR